MKQDFSKTWAIILAAGRGKRMKATEKNKVAYEVGGVPMIQRAIQNLHSAGITNVIVVVGFAKESVIPLLPATSLYVEQTEQLGTGHAVKVAMSKLPTSCENVFVLNGDDSFLLTDDVFQGIFSKHLESNASTTFLSVEIENPTGLGRIVRENGKVVRIVEEKDATEEEKAITEVNAACYLFEYNFLKENIDKIEKSPASDEYYIVSLVEMGVSMGATVDAYILKASSWRGVNTPEELEQAEKLLAKVD